MKLLRVTKSERLSDVRFPFLVFHGSADMVTGQEVSKELYEKAKSGDKKIEIYQRMIHSLLFGEPKENIDSFSYIYLYLVKL